MEFYPDAGDGIPNDVPNKSDQGSEWISLNILNEYTLNKETKS
jgi:hypothetical protein